MSVMVWGRRGGLMALADRSAINVSFLDKALEKCTEKKKYGLYFSSLSWEKNKRYAEQAAALVATICLGITDPNENTQPHSFKNGQNFLENAQSQFGQVSSVDSLEHASKHFKSGEESLANNLWQAREKTSYIYSF